MTASDAGYLERLRNFWFPDCWVSLAWLGLAVPAFYFLQTTIHEGSHAFTNLAATGDFPKVAPFPHATTDGRFLNGVTLRAEGFIATPQFLDLVLVVLLTLIFLFWPIRNRFVKFGLRLFFLAVCIDLLYNTARELGGGHNQFADWSRFQDDYGIGDGWMILLTWFIWLVVFSHFIWVYFSAWHRHRGERTGFWDYRWVTLAFGLLSLCAVLASIFVSDPEIVKGHIYFIGPFIVQILFLIWYGTYFVWTFSRE